MRKHRHAYKVIKDTLSFSALKVLKPQLALCRSNGSVLRLISENCSLNDISMLEYFVNDLNIIEAQDVVQKYKDAIKEFSKTE